MNREPRQLGRGDPAPDDGSPRPAPVLSPPVPRPRFPSPGRSETTAGHSADDGRWELVISPTGIAAVTSAGTVAEAHVSERAGGLVIEFDALGPGLPPRLTAQLVAHAFALPTIGTHRPVRVYVPRRAGELLAHARRYVQGARTRAAGGTCIVEGWTGEHALVSPDPRTSPR